MARESFNLSGLPFEIRTLIWEATLPPTRIFHVKGTTESGINSKILTFHRKHPPPIALHICTESRAAALRNGDYFLAPEPGTGPWFNPKRDILYFDRNQRHMLRSQGGKTRISGWEKVLHVGLEWRAWFRDVPRQTAPGDEDIRRHWRSVVRGIYFHMPAIEGIHYVLPRVRHKGGVTWGREPYKSAQYEAQLVHLPEATEIPWAGAGMGIRNAIHNGAAAGNAAPGVLVIPGATEGSRTLLTMTTWGDIKVDMERALEEELKGDEEDQVAELDWTLANEDGEDEDEDNSKCVFPGNQPPEVVGWWLLRQDAPREDHPSIREFFV
ncbi:uncharacterized protein TRIVIDRAFT_223147 [Trichoderma virens Gv29-8]|uniref:2EXR domain-containing protein n=1 Tax=Hypocrea virens (strain Gv29-8 / FGSC 10586) TaxID=413071 RepID=G9MW86_HYPVG|nr:uncharacterized protein TRIVIDRAFT_223147 [Trichoderma virens Gv29-8]EHK21223.1 hypothetical protein TRIVIDRAFT_223147 [Trichoderma virens Gv29-8]